MVAVNRCWQFNADMVPVAINRGGGGGPTFLTSFHANMVVVAVNPCWHHLMLKSSAMVYVHRLQRWQSNTSINQSINQSSPSYHQLSVKVKISCVFIHISSYIHRFNQSSVSSQFQAKSTWHMHAQIHTHCSFSIAWMHSGIVIYALYGMLVVHIPKVMIVQPVSREKTSLPIAKQWRARFSLVKQTVAILLSHQVTQDLFKISKVKVIAPRSKVTASMASDVSV